MKVYKTTEKERERSRKWYAANKEKKAASTAAYRKLHPDMARQSCAKWRAANPEKVAAINLMDRGNTRSKEWAKKNPLKANKRSADYAKKFPERIRITQQKWVSKNPTYHKLAWQKWYRENKHRSVAKDMLRKAIKLHACPAWAEREIIELIYAEARHRRMCVDHIIPLRGKNVCGLHVHQNMQLLTRAENSSKGNKFPHLSF